MAGIGGVGVYSIGGFTAVSSSVDEFIEETLTASFLATLPSNKKPNNIVTGYIKSKIYLEGYV